MGISAKFQVIFDDSMGEAIIRVEHVGHWVDLGDSIQDLQSFFEHVLEKEVDKNNGLLSQHLHGYWYKKSGSFDWIKKEKKPTLEERGYYS